MNYVQKIQIARDDAMQIAERVTRQYDTDTFQIALSRYEKLNLGYQRIMEITNLWEEVRREYENAIFRHNETDVARAHLDAELLQIAKDEARIIPFERRYPELKGVTYGGRKRHG
jgi:hypothetical protein